MNKRKEWIVQGTLAVLNTEEVWLDLHQYTTDTALEIVAVILEAAWRRGFRRVTIVHGATYIRSPLTAQHRGRGFIKWAIRRALNEGQFMEWAYHARSPHHEKKVVSNRITLALRPNPSPEPELPWPNVPDLETN